MRFFHKVVLVIAGFFFVFSVIFVSVYAVKMTTASQAFPPSSSTCPDLWATVSNASNTKCYYVGYNEGKYLTSDDYSKLYEDANKKKANTYLGVSNDKYITKYVDANNLDHSAIFVDSDKSTVWGSSGSLLCNKNKWASTNNIVWSGVNEASC